MPFTKSEKQMLDMPEVKAFEERGLDIEIAAQMGAAFRNGTWRFEYRNQGELRSTKIKTLDKRFWFEPKGQPLQLWNIDSLRELPSKPKEALALTEGEHDAIAVAQTCRGIHVASVPNGSSGKRSQGQVLVKDDSDFTYLWGTDQKLIPEIEQFDKIVLATDGDEKGIILRDELALRIGEQRCWFLTYPAGCKDANDVLLKHGEDALRELIAGAKPMRPGYLVKPSELPPRRAKNVYSTGLGFLDRHIMIERPELFVITGEPGHGKGQFIRVLAFQLAESQGWKTGFLTPEDPPHRLKRDMHRFALRNVQHHTREAIQKAEEWCDAHFRISQPPEDDPITLDILLQEMETAALHHDCQVFVCDPWNEVYHDYGRLSETQYVERTLMLLKRKARRCNLLLIIAAHPKKIEGKPASLYDISGSANWRNKCDHGLVVYRPSKDSSSVQLIIERCKDHETMGIHGDKWMLFDRSRCDYSEVPEATHEPDASPHRGRPAPRFGPCRLHPVPQARRDRDHDRRSGALKPCSVRKRPETRSDINNFARF
jgi:twinkle protein